MKWLKRIFVWWHGATLSTLLVTWWSGQLVGEDEFGNRYYQNRAGRNRWVIYNGVVEASRVPPDWHGWLHFTFQQPPTLAPFRVQAWEKPYVPNMTGSARAYRPLGSLGATAKHAPSSGDYQPWVPK